MLDELLAAPKPGAYDFLRDIVHKLGVAQELKARTA